jgi:hypothetical protein
VSIATDDDACSLQSLVESQTVPDPGPVSEARTRNLIEYVFTGWLDTQIDKLPLPWFPFRRKVIGAISRAALTLLRAAVILADPAVRACFVAPAIVISAR